MSEIARVAADEVPDGKAVHLEGGEHGVCLVRLGESFHALADRCSHAEVRLSEGEVDADDCSVECWKHGSAFSLEDGRPFSLPATTAVEVYRVRRDGDEIVVEETV